MFENCLSHSILINTAHLFLACKKLQIILKINFSVENISKNGTILEIYVCFYVSTCVCMCVLQDDKYTDYNLYS